MSNALTLLEIQRRMQQAILTRHYNVEDMLKSNTRISNRSRYEVYADAYEIRLREAMSVDFNALHCYLGDAEFEQLMNGYIRCHPSAHFSLRWFGQHLSRYLADTQPYSDHIELPELARFEWALCAAFDAAGAEDAKGAALMQELDLSRINQLDWPVLTLNFVPSIQVFSLRSNVPALWAALTAGTPIPAIALNPVSDAWLIWRKDLTLLYRPLDVIELNCIKLFNDEKSIADVCAFLSDEMNDDAAFHLVSLLKSWIADGLLKNHFR